MYTQKEYAVAFCAIVDVKFAFKPSLIKMVNWGSYFAFLNGQKVVINNVFIAGKVLPKVAKDQRNCL